MNRNVETKHSLQTDTDGKEILHNNFVTMSSTLLQTTVGAYDPTNNSVNNRIGDEINVRGVSLKFMVELNERFSDITLRLFVIKAAKGDVPTRATLFNGLSGNKMLDTFNKERFTILYTKTFKMKAPNQSAAGTSGDATGVSYLGNSAGIYYPAGSSNTGAGFSLSRATKIVKVWIPGNKFGRRGKITYEDNTSQVKFFDYHVMLYAYANYSTAQDVYYVARVNDYIQQMYYKDA